MDNKLKGTITTIKEVKRGDNWENIEFVVSNNDGYQGAEQIFCFEVFGSEKVSKFQQYNKVGDEVEVSFNIRCRAWQDKHFTSLQAWKVMGLGKAVAVPSESVAPEPMTPKEGDGDGDLPF